MATTIDTTECPYCEFLNAIVESDYEEMFQYEGEDFTIHNNCPLCGWQLYENNFGKEKSEIEPKPRQLKEAKKIVAVIDEIDIGSWVDELITDYIIDKFEDLKPEEKLARTFFIDLIKLVFEKKK
jgi:hypothetical protein